eukprot:g16473.t1
MNLRSSGCLDGPGEADNSAASSRTIGERRTDGEGNLLPRSDFSEYIQATRQDDAAAADHKLGNTCLGEIDRRGAVPRVFRFLWVCRGLSPRALRFKNKSASNAYTPRNEQSMQQLAAALLSEDIKHGHPLRLEEANRLLHAAVDRFMDLGDGSLLEWTNLDGEERERKGKDREGLNFYTDWSSRGEGNDRGDGGGVGTQLDRVRRAVWGMLYADDAGVVSKSAEGLGRMMTIIVEVFREFGLTVSERKTLTLVMRVKEKQPPPLPPPPLIIEAAGQRYVQTTEFRYLGGLVNEHGDLTREINHRSKAAWACFKRYKTELFDRPEAPFGLKVRLLKAEAVGALLYGCMTWSPRRDHYRLLRTTHHQLLLRVIGHRRKPGTHRQLSYAQALKRAGCQSVEATIRQRRLRFAGAVARQPDKRLPKRLMFGELTGGEKPGKGSPEQNWLTCLKDDPRVFGATHGSTDDVPCCVFGVPTLVWSEAAKVDGGVPSWHTGVLQGAERFMAAWHKDEEEASLQRAIKRGDSGPENSPVAAPINGAGGGGRKQNRKKANEKRPTAGFACIDPDAQCVSDDDITIAMFEKCGWIGGVAPPGAGDGEDRYCRYGFACIDPLAPCADDDSVTVDMIDICDTVSIGDGYCEENNNIPECAYDGGDDDDDYLCKNGFACIDPEAPCSEDDDITVGMLEDCEWVSGVGNGYCDLDMNIPECNYDGGDCCECTCEVAARADDYSDVHYAGCDAFACIDPEAPCVEASNVTIEMIETCDNVLGIGNGFCNRGNNNELCLYDGGDCCSCTCEHEYDNDYACNADDRGFDCKDPDVPCFGEEKTMDDDHYYDDDFDVARPFEFVPWEQDGPLPTYENAIEVANMTEVGVTATGYDMRPGRSSADVGCGEGGGDGCAPANTRDGIASEVESRWSCSSTLVEGGGPCQIEYTFAEPQDIVNIQLAFWKGNERVRTLDVYLNGDKTFTHESYISGTAFNVLDVVVADDVTTVMLESVGLESDEWISLIEVLIFVKPEEVPLPTVDGAVEVASKTEVGVMATAHDARAGRSYGEPGCGEEGGGGCAAALTRDGITDDIESRWSCATKLTEGGGPCQIEYTFAEPQDIEDIQVAFWKVNERIRTLEVSLDGVVVTTSESYGSTFNTLGVSGFDVSTVTLESVGLLPDEWISLIERHEFSDSTTAPPSSSSSPGYTKLNEPEGCTWADDDLWEEDVVERIGDNSVYGEYHIFAYGEDGDEEGDDDEEEVFFAEVVCLFPSVWGGVNAGPGGGVHPIGGSEWTRTQPRKHGRVRGSGGRRTTTRKNTKRGCPRRCQERHRRRVLRRKQLARRARVSGRRRRPPTSFRGGGDPPHGDQCKASDGKPAGVHGGGGGGGGERPAGGSCDKRKACGGGGGRGNGARCPAGDGCLSCCGDDDGPAPMNVVGGGGCGDDDNDDGAAPMEVSKNDISRAAFVGGRGDSDSEWSDGANDGDDGGGDTDCEG